MVRLCVFAQLRNKKHVFQTRPPTFNDVKNKTKADESNQEVLTDEWPFAHRCSIVFSLIMSLLVAPCIINTQHGGDTMVDSQQSDTSERLGGNFTSAAPHICTLLKPLHKRHINLLLVTAGRTEQSSSTEMRSSLLCSAVMLPCVKSCFQA